MRWDSVNSPWSHISHATWMKNAWNEARAYWKCALWVYNQITAEASQQESRPTGQTHTLISKKLINLLLFCFKMKINDEFCWISRTLHHFGLKYLNGCSFTATAAKAFVWVGGCSILKAHQFRWELYCPSNTNMYRQNIIAAQPGIDREPRWSSLLVTCD